MLDTETVFKIINSGGGIAGFMSLGYLLMKKFRKKYVKLHKISGIYGIEKSKSECGDLNAIVEVAIHNETDETIYLTDIVGTLKYNKEKYEKNIELLAKNIGDTKPTKIERPINYREVTHFSIGPHELIRKTLTFKFSDVIPNLIDRIGRAHLIGILKGDIPLFLVSEEEMLREWENQPLNFLLSAHINGKKVIHAMFPLFREPSSLKEDFSGSLNIVDLTKIERNFWKDQWKLMEKKNKIKI